MSNVCVMLPYSYTHLHFGLVYFPGLLNAVKGHVTAMQSYLAGVGNLFRQKSHIDSIFSILIPKEPYKDF